MLVFEDFHKAYKNILQFVYENGEIVNNTKEILNFAFKITNAENIALFTCNSRKYPIRYLIGELNWYYQGRNDLKYIKQFSAFWEKIVNPDNKTLNSAYGYLIFEEQNPYGSEFKWALDSLINSKDTRQAIIRFNKPHHSFKNNKDFPCTMYAIFHIRNNKLHITVHMRSSDLIKGITYDIPFFQTLHHEMYLNLIKKYSDLKFGDFAFFTNSIHIYNNDFEIVENILNDDSYEKIDLGVVDVNLYLNEELNALANYAAKKDRPNLKNIKFESKFIENLKNVYLNF